MAGSDLFLRSDSDKQETGPDPDIRLRAQSDKETVASTGTLDVILADSTISAAGISEGAILVADLAALERSLLSAVMEYGYPQSYRKRRAAARSRGGPGLREDVLERQRKKQAAIFDDEELIAELLD